MSQSSRSKLRAASLLVRRKSGRCIAALINIPFGDYWRFHLLRRRGCAITFIICRYYSRGLQRPSEPNLPDLGVAVSC